MYETKEEDGERSLRYWSDLRLKVRDD